MELEEIEKLVKDLDRLSRSAKKIIPHLEQFVRETEVTADAMPKGDLKILAMKMRHMNVCFVYKMITLNLKAFIQLLDNNSNELQEMLIRR